MEQSPRAARPFFARTIRLFWPIVLLFWFLVIAGTKIAVPSLEEVGNERAVSLAAEDAPSLQAAKHMGRVFRESQSDNSVMILLESDQPFRLGDAAHKYYENILRALRQDHKHVLDIKDFWGDPNMADGVQSTDNKATYVQVALAGNQASALANESVQAVRDVLANTKAPKGVRAYLTGGSALSLDVQNASNASAWKIELTTFIVLVGILLVTYRSLTVLVLMLLMIGITLTAAEGAVAFLGHYGLIGLTPIGTKMVTALTIAVSTDYVIFLVGRYQTARRVGEDRERAYYTMIRSVAHVILGSGLTVAGSLYCLSFARLPTFNAISVPTAASVLVSIAVSLTLCPAVIALCSRFGIFDPKAGGSTKGWRKVGAAVARWPGPILVGSCAVALVGLLALLNYKPSYNDRSYIPQNIPANMAYDVAGKHFSISRMSPDTLMVETNHDMRNPADMLVLERVAKAIYHLPGIARAQSITRPGGTTPMAHTSFGYMMGGQQNSTIENLSYQKARLADMKKQLDMLDVQIANTETQYELSKKMAEISREVLEVDTPKQLKTMLATEDKAAVMEDYLRIERNLFNWIGSDCYDWSWCWALRNSMDSMDSISDSIDQFENSVERQRQTYQLNLKILELTPPVIAMQKKQRAMQQAAYSTQLGQMRQQVLSMEHAGVMGKAFDTAHNDDSFYLGPEAFDDPDFKKALKTFLSPDGKAARFFVTHEGDSMSAEGISHIEPILNAAKDAIKGTPLEGSKLFITGAASTIKDLRDGATYDLMIAAVSALSLIMVIMIILMRSLVAALVIVGTVALSLGASFGLSVLIWQDILGIPLHWSVLVVSIIIMLAVGSDYNLLFVARLKEEMHAGIKTGLIRTMGATGSMETAAGVVFALTMGALVVSDLRTVAQLGMAICLGILFDTFIVRAFMTPPIAAILGRWFWWPMNVRSRPLRVRR